MAKIIKCKICSNEIASNAKVCPSCGATNKRPLYKRPGLIVAILIGVSVIGSLSIGVSTTTNSSPNKVVESKKVTESVAANTNKVEEQEEATVPTEYKSALKKAEQYSETMNMSKKGIYSQLTSEYGEQFSIEAAQYAMDNIEADWKANALEKAKVYQETMAMSPNAIYDQLIAEYGEQFTAEEAQYAVDHLE